MKKYFVQYEVREHGAIGIWCHGQGIVEAASQEVATDAFREKYAEQWDFRFPKSVMWLDGDDLLVWIGGRPARKAEGHDCPHACLNRLRVLLQE